MFPKYPYLDLSDRNLDFLTKTIRELENEVKNFVSLNAVKYANPIQWSIVQQYEKNTIVIDPLNGTAYISVSPVPVGVLLTNTRYWTVVFDLERFTTQANSNFTVHIERQTTLTATFPTNKNRWLIWGGVLYKATTNIIAGDQYVVNSNIVRITIEELVGYTENLLTTNKSNLVSAINEVLTLLNATSGDLNELQTWDKTNLVNAINELFNLLTATVGDLDELTTTDKSNIVNAINELVNAISELSTSVDNIVNGNTTFNKLNAPNDVILPTPTPINNEYSYITVHDSTNNEHRIAVVSDSFTGTATNKFDNFHKLLMVGDSWAIVNESQDRLTPWVSHVVTNLGLNSSEYTILAEGGYGFSDPVYKWKELIKTAVDTQAIDPSSYSVVCIVGGGNEENVSTTILNDMEDCLNYINTTFTNAKICVGFGFNSPMINDKGAVRIRLTNYMNCQLFGAAYMSGIENSIHNFDTDYADDPLHHINDHGSERLGMAVSNYLLGGSIDVFRFPVTVPMVWNDALFTTASSNAFLESQKQGTIYRHCYAITNTLLNEIDVTADSAIVVGTIEPHFVSLGSVYAYMRGLVGLRYRPNADEVTKVIKYINAQISVNNDGQVVLTPRESLERVDRVTLMSNDFYFDCLFV